MTMQGVLAGLVLLLGGSLLAGPLTRPPAGDSTPSKERQQAPRPNIIFVLTDDLDRNLGTLDQVPRLKEMLEGQGVTFPNMFVTGLPHSTTIIQLLAPLKRL